MNYERKEEVIKKLSEPNVRKKTVFLTGFTGTPLLLTPS